MAWFPEPAIVSILLDANRVAPKRSHASDGIIGDASHAASVSDHNPDTDGGVHACDITNDPAGGFDAWQWAHAVSNRIVQGLETRVKYLVSNDGKGCDQIFSKRDGVWAWRQNGSCKTEHRSHLHVSILYTDAAENDQTPFFSPAAPKPTTPPAPPPAQENTMHASLAFPVNLADPSKGSFVHTWWVDNAGRLQHNYAPGKVEILKVNETLDRTQPVTAQLNPSVFGGIEVRAVTTPLTGSRLVLWSFGPKGWGSTALAPLP